MLLDATRLILGQSGHVRSDSPPRTQSTAARVPCSSFPTISRCITANESAVSEVHCYRLISLNIPPRCLVSSSSRTRVYSLPAKKRQSESVKTKSSPKKQPRKSAPTKLNSSSAKKRKAESESDEGYTDNGQQATKGEKGGGRGGGKKARTAGENSAVLKTKGLGKKRQTITSEEEQDEEGQKEKRGGYEQAEETHEQDEEEGDKAAEEESREEDDTSEKYTGGPSQSSPGSQGSVEYVLSC